jgi:hypothetical protein
VVYQDHSIPTVHRQSLQPVQPPPREATC